MLITILSITGAVVVIGAVVGQHARRSFYRRRLRRYRSAIKALGRRYRAESDVIQRAGILARIQLHHQYYIDTVRHLPARDRAEAYNALTSDLQNF